MPYKSVKEAESKNPGIRNLSPRQKKVWVSVFNSAKEQGKNDEIAAKIAWSAVSKVKKGEVNMTEIAKATLAVEGENIAFGIPFTKISIKDRTVEGFATLDNIDKQGDIVDFEASKEAFKYWIGNIREMHAPKAVGKAIEIKEKTYTDASTGKKYNGIWVKSRISKGAPDTWEKIIDGTLSGYSVGGRVLERKPEIVKTDDGRFSKQAINRITKYHLGELSVVDNPMNPLAVFQDITKGTSILKLGDEDRLIAGDAIVEPKGLFYCETCDVAKTDDFDATTVECVSCDEMMSKIGEVEETVGVTELKKMVDDYKDKLQKKSGSNMIINPDDYVTDEDEKLDGEVPRYTSYNEDTRDIEVKEVFPVPPIEDVNPHLVSETSLPEGAPQQGAMKAEGTGDDTEIKIAEKLLEALKGRAKSKNGKKSVYKHEEIEYFEAMSNEDLYKVTNANASPPKGYPKERDKYADPANYKYPIDTPSRIKAAVSYFNHSGQRAAGGYSMGQWAAIGRKIASAASRTFDSRYRYSGGKIIGISDSDSKKAEIIFNLQKNNTNVNTIKEVLKSIFGFIREDSYDTGGENPTLEFKEAVEKVLDIFDVAKKEAEEVMKSFAGVKELNSEDASDVSVGGTDPGQAGVGTSDANDGGSAMGGGDVTVATPTAFPTPDAGPEKVVSDKIETDSGSANPGTNDYQPSNVLPHADLPATSNPAKADGAEDLQKALTEYFDKKFEEVGSRIEALESSGATKKSSEVNDDNLEKGKTSESVWGGAWLPSE